MQKEKTRSLKLNIITSMVIQVLSLLINIVSKRALRMYLGLEYLGIQSIYSNYCEVMSIAFVGIGTAMMFSMYGAFARDNEGEIVAYYRYYDNMYSIITKIVLIGGAVSTLLVLYTVNGDTGVLEVCITYLTYLLSIMIFNRQLVRNFFIQADQRRYVVAFVTGGVDVVALLVEVFILYYYHSYEGFLVCIVLKNLLTNYIFKLYLNKRYPYLFEPGEELGKKEKDSIVENMKELIVYRFGKVLISNTDSIFVSRFTSTLMAGIFSNYQFVVLGVRSVLAALSEAIKGRIGNQAQTKSLEVQYKNFRKYLFMNSWLLGISIICFYFLVDDFIFVWMGDVESLSWKVILLLIVNYYLEESQFMLRAYRETAGIFHNIRTMTLAKGILNIIFSFIFGYFWGLTGVLTATTISSIVTLFWYEPKVMYGYFKKNPWNEALYHIVTIVLLVLSFGVTYLLVGHMQGAGILYLVFKAAVCLIVSNLVYLVVVLVIWFLKRWKKREK